MRKVMIMGCPGSGKTTLARKLSCKLNLPLVHLDVLNWRDHWQPVSTEEFDALLLQEVRKEAWIIDGNYHRTIPLRLEHCDTVIYLEGNCPERFDFSFFKFVWDFNKNNRKNYLEMLSHQKDKTVIIFHNRRECSEFLRKL